MYVHSVRFLVLLIHFRQQRIKNTPSKEILDFFNNVFSSLHQPYFDSRKRNVLRRFVFFLHCDDYQNYKKLSTEIDL